MSSDQEPDQFYAVAVARNINILHCYKQLVGVSKLRLFEIIQGCKIFDEN